MAINVNTVYQTVLLILNKEQRGYMTPIEFNRTGEQAQLEIFETYFESLNQQLRIPQADTDFSDRVTTLDEKISLFKEFGSAISISSSNVFNLPQQFSGLGAVLGLTTSLSNTGTITTDNNNLNNGTNLSLATENTIIEVGMTVTGAGIVGNVTITFISVTNQLFTLSSAQTIAANTSLTFSSGLVYTISATAAGQTVTANQVDNSVVELYAGGSLVSSTDYSVSGLTITFYVQPPLNRILIVNIYPKQFYKLGSSFYTAGALPAQEIERVDSSSLYHMLGSNLTKPTTTYPIYTYKKNQLTVYPTTITSGITLSYIRKPLNPVWNFTVANNAYVFNQLTSFNFELHPAEQTELILKILLYAGVVVKDPQIVQVAASQVAQENQNQQR
jgi:hypothetical protein